jgi:hypothetical protein
MPARTLPPVLSVAARGAAAGAAGTVAMTLGELLEQRLTHRPDSYVPAHTLARLLGLRDPDADRPARNWAMHLGTGASVGILRAVMARANLRGPAASFLHTWVRLSVDQTLENGTGAGAPPPSWPRRELVIDVAHKASYSFATGVIADRLIAPRATSSQRRPFQRLRLPGFS